jgi:hypothetical protein
MRRSTKIVRLVPVGVALVVGSLITANSAFANYDDGVKTVGTSFTRESHEYGCAFSGCYFDAHFPLTQTCTKTASSRLRFQRDLQPDQTVRESDNFTTCTNYYWDNFHSEANHAHHMDGKVTSGTGKEHFFYTDTHT